MSMMRLVFIIGIIISLGVAVEVVRLLQLKASVNGNATYWQQRAAEPAPANALVYVALGDSVAQGLGATSPDKGYVGLVATAMAQQTGRPVQVINLSVTGAKLSDVIAGQLPAFAKLKPDIVTLDIGANDAHTSVDGADFKRDYVTIMAALPADRTVVADLPAFGYRNDHGFIATWNPFVQAQIASHDLKLAPVNAYLTPRKYDPRIYGADLFHPDNYGYRAAWFEAFWPQIKPLLSKER